MKKRLKYGCMIIFVVSAILVSIIQLGKVLNHAETKETSQDVEDIVASLGELKITGGSLSGANANEMYTFRSDTYCAGHGWALPRRLTYSATEKLFVPDGGIDNAQQVVEWERKNVVDIPQCIAYARANGAKNEELQRVVWSSYQWSDYGYEKSCLIDIDRNKDKISSTESNRAGRSYQFANFVYIALNGNKLGLKCSPSSPTKDNDAKLKVMVDQSNCTYTVGPYSITFDNCDDTGVNGWNKSMGKLVYDEILKRNPGETTANQFCTGSVYAEIDGTNNKKNYVSNIQLIDENGAVISAVNGVVFPEFGKKFYVRYTTSVDADQIQMIKPVIRINYMTKFSGKAYVYRSSSITYNMTMDYAGIFQSVIKTLEISHIGLKIERDISSGYWLVVNKPENDPEGKGRSYPTSANQDAFDELKGLLLNWGNSLELALRQKIKELCSSWGLNDEKAIQVILEQEIGYYYKNQFYPNTNITPSMGYPTEDREVWKCTNHNQTFYSANAAYQHFEATNEDSRYLDRYTERRMQLAVYNLPDGSTYRTNWSAWWPTGDHYDDNAYNRAIDAILAQLKNDVKIYFAAKVSKIQIIEKNGKIQPAVQFDSIAMPIDPEPDKPNPPVLPPPPDPTKPGQEIHYWKKIDTYIEGEIDTEKDYTLDIDGDGEIEIRYEWDETRKTQWKFFSNLQGAVEKITLPGKDINMYIGGNVWQSLPSVKLGEFGSKKNEHSLNLAGIQVELYDATTKSRYYNTRRLCTRTDAQGEYGFQGLNPMHQYRIVFTYDGMRFEDTTYTNNLTGGYSTADEGKPSASNRTNFNDKFDEIYSSPRNYISNGSNRKAYGLYSKIEDSSGNYIKYTNSGTNSGSFRYYDALQIFKTIATNSHNFIQTNANTMNSSYYSLKDGKNETYSNLSGTFKQRLQAIGKISDAEVNNIWNYIMDTLISASTIAYPEEKKFTLENVSSPQNGSTLGYPNLYNKSKDMSRHVDFGMYLRTNADLALTKDLYKCTVLVNGKKQEYVYDKKKSETDMFGNWYVNMGTGTYEYKETEAKYPAQTVPQVSDSAKRNSNKDYVGEQYGGNTYTREIRKSEYLYDGSDAHPDGNAKTEDQKNLQVFVTYKIAIKNQSQNIFTSVSEIVDYYDSSNFTFDVNSTIIKDNTFLGDRKGNKIGDLNVSENSIYTSIYGSMTGYNANSSNINEIYNYSSLFLTGIREDNGEERLSPGQLTYAYITFKVVNDTSTQKVKIDQDIGKLLNGQVEDTIGKRNIAEINGYKTFYRNGTEGNYTWSKAGVIDVDSNPGSLKAKDLNSNGDIISSNNSWENRLEDDCDKAGNLKLKIDQKDPRNFSGYVFEDARTDISDNAVIGNGEYNTKDKDVQNNADKKINGVTVELVELVQETTAEGFFTGNYTGEHVWSSISYGTNLKANINDTRYYSGTKSSKVILSGPGIFAVTAKSLTEGAGEYMFESLPPGDFFIRFKYGDTSQTVLTNSNNNDVQKLINQLTNTQKSQFVSQGSANGILGTTGLNSRSYTGQDYKSTVYQKGIDQNSSYNGITGFINFDDQNYKDYKTKASMYYYDIAKSAPAKNVSDAKDVYSYREKEMSYSSGSTSNSSITGLQTLKNHRAEVLASATQLVLKAQDALDRNDKATAAEYQRKAIEELIKNTAMVAQTGVINTEVEYNKTKTQVYDETTKNYIQDLSYNVQDIDLGLTERPEAQLALSKELVNVQVRLASGQILFDATQSIPNLSYGSHYTHKNVYETGNRYRLRTAIAKEQEERMEELVTAYMDEELMSGATIRLIYKITVDNIGEVDYNDKQFYYTGKTNSATVGNMSKTGAVNVIDYVTNEINYEPNYQNESDDWGLVTVTKLLGSTSTEDDNLVNDIYEDNLNTYNILITTKKLNGSLVPRAVDSVEPYSRSRRELYLTLSTLLTNTTQEKNLTYNNLIEILETTNTLGRRMQLSKAGNQAMAYQSKDKTEDGSTTWITPSEIDSDSGQKTQVMVPTGENKNINRAIVITITALVIVGISIYMIRKKILLKKY